MWLEFIVSKEDLVALVASLCPVTIHLSGGGSVAIDAPRQVTLVPDEGLRLTCHAKLHWPVLGIPVPVTLHAMTMLVKPQIAASPTGDRLVFTLALEKADFAALPDVIDQKITEKINEKLARDRVELEWDFSSALSHVFPLPKMLEQVEAIGLQVAWGEVRVTEDALVFAISFHARIARTGEDAVALPPVQPAEPIQATSQRTSAAG